MIIIGLIRILNRLIEFLKNLLVYLSPNVAKINLVGNQVKLINTSKDNLTRILVKENGVWEEDELKLFSIIISGITTFIDIGANIGLYSILAEKCNPSLKSYSFEPSPANAKRMKENLKLNEIINCTIIENVIGDKNEMISFFVPSDKSSTSVSSTSEAFTSSWHNDLIELSVKQITLDSFIKEYSIERVDLIKLDAEYHELNVLNGAKELFQMYKPAVLCEVNIYEILTYYLPTMKNKISKTLSYDIENFFKDINYNIYSIGKDGIMRVDGIHLHPDVRNFLFSPVKSKLLFIPYSNKADIINIVAKGNI